MRALMVMCLLCVGAGKDGLDDPEVKHKLEIQREAEIRRLTNEIGKPGHPNYGPRVNELRKQIAFLKNPKNAWMPEIDKFADGEIGTLYNKSAKVVKVIDASSAVVSVEEDVTRNNQMKRPGGTWREHVIKIDTSGWKPDDVIHLPQVFRVAGFQKEKRKRDRPILEPIADKSPAKPLPKKKEQKPVMPRSYPRRR